MIAEVGSRRFGRAIRLVSTVGLEKSDWLRIRQENGFGSSDAGSVSGFNPYCSQRQLFNERVGLVPPFEGNEATEMGTLLEEPGAVLYARRTGNEVERVRAVLQDPDHPFMIADLDRVVVGQKKVVEIKSSGEFAHKNGDWGDPEIEPDRIPTQYLCQVQWQMAVTGYPVADLALIVGGRRFFVYRDIARDEKFIASMIAIAQPAWAAIQKGRETVRLIADAYGYTDSAQLLAEIQTESAPSDVTKRLNSLLDEFRPLPATYDEASQAWSMERKAIQATSEIIATYDRFCELNEEKSRLEKLIDVEKTALANYMRECDELLIDGKTALTFRSVTRKAYSVAESSSRQMRRVKAK